MDIRTKAVKDLAAKLTNVGAVFKIIAADGTEFGTLVAVAPKERTRRHNVYVNMGLRDTLAAMKPGDVLRLPVPEGDTVERFRSGVGTTARKLFGAGNANAVASPDKTAVDVLRLL